mmetsp:Transcript_31403/g.36270  ORF Transcript_31403/g.36270 Transcript_31403/m.36270 type:complete len:297 (+) Transcript_31403:34-924(+)
MDQSDSLLGSEIDDLEDEVLDSNEEEVNGEEDSEQEDAENGEEEEENAGEEQEEDSTNIKKGKAGRRHSLTENLTKKDAEEYKAREARKGVVYLSRIPPYMKVSTVRKYFEQYQIGRIYLAPEPEGVRKLRQKAGGNKRRCYSEGWIEFEDKNQAKLVAMAFNNKRIGGKKRNFYYDDIWNIRYLPKFKWDNLTEKIVYDKKVRDAKLKAELSMAKKQQEYYLDQVEKGKHIDRIIRHKAKRQAEKGLDEDAEVIEAIQEQQENIKKNSKPKEKTDNDKDDNRIRRVFKQKNPMKI